MDIKLKRIGRKPLTKFIAFILTIILISAIALQLTYIGYANLNPESIVGKEYKNSKAFGNEVNETIRDVYDLLEAGGDKRIQNVSYLYMVMDKDNILTNANNYNRTYYQSYKDAFFGYIEGEYMLGDRTSASLDISFPQGEDYTMYLAFPNSFMLEGQKEWDNGRERLIPLIYSITALFIVVVFLISYLILVAGRKFGTEDLYLSSIDKIYSEVLLLGFFPIIGLFLSLHKILYYTQKAKLKLTYNHIYNMYLIATASLVLSVLFLVSVLSLSRKVKNRSFYKGSITYIIIRRLSPYIKDLLDENRFKENSLVKILDKRQKLFIGASGILIFSIYLLKSRLFLVMMAIILQLIIVYWYMKLNQDTFSKIDIDFDESLKEQMKAERMKVDLITNVSHDLKTPLTSIISYVDLLSKEKDLSTTARDYVNILSEKSNRLKEIVIDVFDLARSTSGDISLELQTLDLKKLLQQTLGDMEDAIENSGFKIKAIFPESPVTIESDGARLYRVFQNIIDNSLRYSLVGTRVYIELVEKDGEAFVTIKNIAAYEMNFTSEEILQRFNRGDGSRTSEGSGLGLSIAQSFTRACGGDFEVEIDGDMFKVIISFNTVQLMEDKLRIGG